MLYLYTQTELRPEQTPERIWQLSGFFMLPLLSAHTTNRSRVVVPAFEWMLCKCVLAVVTETPSQAAICLVLKPRTIKASTSCSRGGEIDGFKFGLHFWPP